MTADVGRAPHDAADSCQSCRYFNDDRASLEDSLPGLAILGSAWASVRGHAGLCECHQVFMEPGAACADYEPRGRVAGS